MSLIKKKFEPFKQFKPFKRLKHLWLYTNSDSFRERDDEGLPPGGVFLIRRGRAVPTEAMLYE
jgi:hypothetical protein